MEAKTLAEKFLVGIVNANLATYRQLFAEANAEEATDPYWKSALAFFENLNQDEKETFFAILKQVSVDTVSNIVGAIDGCSDIGLNEEVRLVDRHGKVISGSLQDYFLEATERE